MDITNINLGACPLQYLSVGYVGETGARPVKFDFSAWATEYGSGVLQLLLQRPGDANPYPVVLNIDGTTATWTPDATATEKTGQGQAQLIYTVGGVVVKNAIFRVLIAPSLGAAGDPPEPYEDWLEQLTELAAETQQSAIDAAGSAEAAGTSAGAAAGSAGKAKAAAEEAEESVTHYPVIINGYWCVWDVTSGEYVSTGIKAQGPDGFSPTVVITAITGGHRVTITDANGPHVFDVLDGAKGDKGDPLTYDDLTEEQKADLVQGPILDAQNDAIAAVEAKGEEVIESIPDFQKEIDKKAPAIYESIGPAAIASFADGADNMPLKSLVVDIPVTQSGTGDPSPENVRPFVGRTALKVYDEPHNSFFPGLIHWNQMVKNGNFANGATGWTGSTYTRLSVSDGTLTVSTTEPSTRSYTVSQALATIAEHVYYATAKIRRELDTVGTGSARTGYALRIGDKTIRSYTLENVGDEANVSEVFTADTRTSINVIKDRCKPAAGAALFSVRDVMLVDLTEAFGAGNEPTAEEFRALFPAAYYEDNVGQEMTISEVNGERYNTLDIPVPAEAGTVYAGPLTINQNGSGTLSALPHYASYNGETLVGPWVSSIDVYAEGATPTIGAEVVDLGGVATVYPLTAEQIRTLKGDNNIWSDAGDVSAVYPADTKAYIDEQTAELAGEIDALEAAQPKTVTVTGTVVSITAEDNTRYKCGEVSTLDITLPASGIVDVVFTSGTTPTVLTVTPPTGVTLRWANGFDPDNLNAETTYEINICDGLGVAASWT